MKRLKLLGGASIDDVGGTAVTGRAVQRRRIALLALLATRTRTSNTAASAALIGMSRDKLMAYLWPDAGGERARHLLSDSVYRINHELGGDNASDVIVAVGDELRLDPAALSSDVADFDTATAAGEHARAVELYDGPFLDGFFLSECAELEKWIEQQRARYARDYLASLEALGAAAAAAGERTAAVSWLRCAATQDPHSSRIALRLMEALEAAGERAAAIQHAAVHTILVRSDFAVEPDSAISQYAEQLRKGAAGTGKVAPVSSAAPRAALHTQAAANAGVTAPPAAPSAQRRSEALAPTHLSAAGREPTGDASVVASPDHAAGVRSAGRRPRLLALAIIAGVAALAIFLVMSGRRGDGDMPNARSAAASGRAAQAAPSVAVLPFLNLSTDPETEYFADGVTDELIATLGRIEGLKVAARTSTFAFKESTPDIRDVARRLGVASVLEGSVRKEGRQVRIAARLVDAESGYRLWSDEYNRELGGMLAVQADIAGAIAAALERRFTSAPNEKLTGELRRDPTAYELYLKGRYAWHQRTERSLRAARDYFDAAVKRVPDYARAWVGLADAYAVSAFYDYVPPREGYPRAEEAARRALALDSALAPPHATLGYVNLYFHWNWPAAEAQFRRAITKDPEYSTAHQWYGNFLTAMGRFAEAQEAFARATEAEPLSLIAAAASGWSRYYARAYDEAEQHFRHTLQLDSTYELAYLWRGQTNDVRGRYGAAVADLTRAVELSQGSSLSLAALAHALAGAGRRDSAASVLAAVEARAPRRYIPSYEIAKNHVALGDTAAALAWFERAYRERAHSMVFLRVDPQLAGMQRHPRYAALLERVGLSGAAR